MIAHPGTIRIAEGDHEKLAGKAILQIFKANREKVAAYERDNNLSKTNNVRARAIAAVMQWAQAQPTDALKYDATLFATEVASSLQAAYDRSKGMDDSFRSKFNGLFTGPLSDGNLEILSERYVYQRQLRWPEGQGRRPQAARHRRSVEIQSQCRTRQEHRAPDHRGRRVPS